MITKYWLTYQGEAIMPVFEGDVIPRRGDTVRYGKGDVSYLYDVVHVCFIYGQTNGVADVIAMIDLDNERSKITGPNKWVKS